MKKNRNPLGETLPKRTLGRPVRILLLLILGTGPVSRSFSENLEKKNIDFVGAFQSFDPESNTLTIVRKGEVLEFEYDPVLLKIEPRKSQFSLQDILQGMRIKVTCAAETPQLARKILVLKNQGFTSPLPQPESRHQIPGRADSPPITSGLAPCQPLPNPFPDRLENPPSVTRQLSIPVLTTAENINLTVITVC